MTRIKVSSLSNRCGSSSSRAENVLDFGPVLGISGVVGRALALPTGSWPRPPEAVALATVAKGVDASGEAKSLVEVERLLIFFLEI